MYTPPLANGKPKLWSFRVFYTFHIGCKCQISLNRSFDVRSATLSAFIVALHSQLFSNQQKRNKRATEPFKWYSQFRIIFYSKDRLHSMQNCLFFRIILEEIHVFLVWKYVSCALSCALIAWSTMISQLSECTVTLTKMNVLYNNMTTAFPRNMILCYSVCGAK